MSKIAKLTPRWDAARQRWALTIPPRHSPTGRRRREFYARETDAEARSQEIWRNQELSRRVVQAAGPELIRTAVNFDELFRDIYGFQGGLGEACEAFIERLDREQRSPRFGELVESYKEAHHSGWSKPYQAKWKWFVKAVEPLASRITVGMDGQFWSDWLASACDGNGWGPGTYNDLLTITRSVWTHAVGKNLASRNPLEGLRRRPVPVEAKKIYTVEETERILKCAWDHDREMVPFFAIAIFAGLRPDDGSEISQLTWEDVNFEEKWIRAGGSFKNKTKTKRYVEMEENLRQWLAPWEGRTGPVTPPNLTKRRQWILRGKYTSEPGTPEDQWTELAPSGEDYRDVTRHTYGSYLDGKYRDRSKVMTNMGHTSPRTYEQHYKNARTPKEAEAFWSIVPPEEEGA